MAHNLGANRTSWSPHPSHSLPSGGYTLGWGIFIRLVWFYRVDGLGEQPLRLTVLAVCAILLASNAVLYSSVGLMFWCFSHTDQGPSGTSEAKDKK